MKEQRLTSVAFWSGILLTMLPFAILSWFILPGSDDYCFATSRIQHGLIGIQAYTYQTWTGRYASTAIMTALPLQIELYRMYAFVTILGIFGALHGFIAVCIGRYASRRECAAAAAILTTVYLNLMPLPAEGLYWHAGTVTYQWANIFTLAVLALTIAAARADRASQRAALTIGAVLLTVVAAAMNESSMMALAGALALGAALTLRTPGKRTPWIATLICACVCALIVVKSPGNAIRAGFEQHPGNLLRTLILATLDVGIYFSRWLSSASLLLGTVLCIPAGLRIVHAMRARSAAPPRALVAVAAVLVVLWLMFLPPSWGMGTLPPKRTLNAVSFIFLIGWGAIVISLLYEIPERASTMLAELSSPRAALILTIVFVVTLMSNNVVRAYSDLVRVAPAYRAENNRRLDELRSARSSGVRDVILTAFEHYPLTIAVPSWDLQADAQNWTNRCFAELNGFRSVATRP